jgi:putative transposase
VIYMVREERKKSRSGVYHIMLRGINRQTIFEDDEDKLKFLETLKKYKAISQFQLYSYCLMDNHVHLLIREMEETIAEAIKRISSSYVYWYNFKYERIGHLFQERFKSERVESRSYFITVLRYIHQNPLKAGLAKSVWECKWTSTHEYVHQVDMVDIDLGLQLFSEDRQIAMRLFIDYMQQQNQDQCLDDNVKFRMPDSEVREHLTKMGITNSSFLQSLDKEERDHVLIMLKELKGVNIRQLSRITGISKSVIQRARL